MSDEGRRTAAEWVTFVASAAVLLVVVALILVQLRDGESPAAPVAEVSTVRDVGGSFHVEVIVRNEGDTTAAEVQVNAELDVDGQITTGDQVIDFVSGGEEEDLVFVFADDPAEGELTVEVSGYAVP